MKSLKAPWFEQKIKIITNEAGKKSAPLASPWFEQKFKISKFKLKSLKAPAWPWFEQELKWKKIQKKNLKGKTSQSNEPGLSSCCLLLLVIVVAVLLVTFLSRGSFKNNWFQIIETFQSCFYVSDKTCVWMKGLCKCENTERDALAQFDTHIWNILKLCLIYVRMNESFV